MNKTIVKNIIFPMSDILTGWNVSSTLKQLRDTMNWNADAIKEYHCERLSFLLNHCRQNVPYYRHLFELYGVDPASIKTAADLKVLPVLTKEAIRENYDNRNLLAEGIDTKRLISVHSSGSTGVRTPLFITRHAYGYNLACNIRGWEQMGYSIGDRLIKISQNQRGSLLKKMQDKMNNTILFSLPYTNEGLNEFTRVFNAFQPEFLRSYPEPLLLLAGEARKHAIRLDGVKAINTTGNILFAEARTVIEKFFGCPVFDSYSCEGGAVAFECPTHDHYHIAEEYGLVEIIGPDGNEVGENETGRIIVTDLQNTAFPFVRYDSKDYAVKGGPCPLGIAHKTIKKVIGRDNDILVTPARQYLIAQTFTTYFKYFPEINQFQVYQPSAGRLVFRLLPNGQISTQTKADIINYWQAYTNCTMDIEIEEVGVIDPLSSGKARFLIRNPEISITDLFI